MPHFQPVYPTFSKSASDLKHLTIIFPSKVAPFPLSETGLQKIIIFIQYFFVIRKPFLPWGAF